MKELHIDRFDALLSLASAECVKEEAEAFLSADISGIEDNPQMLRKILGAPHKSKWKTVKIIMLVALLCMSIAFTACMLIPEVRNALWNIFVKGHGDHVEIGFGDETEAATEPPVVKYPKTIEQRAQLLYQLDEWVEKEEEFVPQHYTIFFSSDTNEFRCRFTQSIIDTAYSYIDNKAGQIAHLEINQYKAVLIEQSGDLPLYSLIWQDDQYRYTICGYFPSLNVLVKVAEGVSISE